MHFSNLVLPLLAAGSASAQMSICDKYTTALLKQNTAANQYTLLKLLVNTALIGNFTGPGTKHTDLPGSMVTVDGILAADGPLVSYFDGSMADINGAAVNMGSGPVKLNFLDGGGATPILADPTSAGKQGSAQYLLITHLWSYFGSLLGCSQYGSSGFPGYSGTASQYAVHKYMNLGESQLTYFIKQVGDAATSFGASASDVTTVANSLNNAFGMRCSAPAPIIKAQGAQLQAICIASSCPLASDAVCASYGGAATPTPMASTPAAATSAAATGAPAPISQISDGQPQATVPATAQYTGAAAIPTMAAQAVVAAGALAAAMAL